MAQLKPITKAPRALAGFARRQNELLKALKPLLNINAGPGIVIVATPESIFIRTLD